MLLPLSLLGILPFYVPLVVGIIFLSKDFAIRGPFVNHDVIYFGN